MKSFGGSPPNMRLALQPLAFMRTGALGFFGQRSNAAHARSFGGHRENPGGDLQRGREWR